MILRFFCLYDSKMNLFMNPMTFQSRGQALRAIADEINRPVVGAEPPTTLQVHPEDLALYELGEFDSERGSIQGNVVGGELVARCGELRTEVRITK